MSGVFTEIVGAVAGADGDHHTILAAAVLQVMPVLHPLRPCGDVARAQHRLAAVLDQHRLAREDHDQLVLLGMPVALRRPRAGLQHDMRCAKVGQTGGRPQPANPAPGDIVVVRRGIAGTVRLRDRLEIELGHDCSLRLESCGRLV
jgi:hypothetical protein